METDSLSIWKSKVKSVAAFSVYVFVNAPWFPFIKLLSDQSFHFRLYHYILFLFYRYFLLTNVCPSHRSRALESRKDQNTQESIIDWLCIQIANPIFTFRSIKLKNCTKKSKQSVLLIMSALIFSHTGFFHKMKTLSEETSVRRIYETCTKPKLILLPLKTSLYSFLKVCCNSFHSTRLIRFNWADINIAQEVPMLNTVSWRELNRKIKRQKVTLHRVNRH